MEQIVYYNRYLQCSEIEQVYGDNYLRWTYGTFAGKLALAAAVKRAWFSRWYGWRMNQPATRDKIAPFIQQYGLDASEFAKRPEDFAHFNDFFYRKLTAAARPINDDPNSIVFPADGRHLCVPDLSQAEGLFVKGQMFSLRSLLRDDKLAQQYAGGALILSRLCPLDYHRFHFPAAGQAGPTRVINGPLYSVNPIALCQNIRILTTNRRTLSVLQTARFGQILLMEIGATCVGGIQQTYTAGTQVAKGDEKGYFYFGGSSTITIFEPGRIRFDADLVDNSAQHRELYAHMGDRAGTGS
ncbi:MAG: phosphatidylserine decarboxylase [Planctomycetales bacterium]|nr:phosphatidylserine decarboxylase [Planctomycetales bacterium]